MPVPLPDKCGVGVAEQRGYGVSRESRRERMRRESVPRIVEARERLGDPRGLGCALESTLGREWGEGLVILIAEHERAIPWPTGGEPMPAQPRDVLGRRGIDRLEARDFGAMN